MESFEGTDGGSPILEHFLVIDNFDVKLEREVSRRLIAQSSLRRASIFDDDLQSAQFAEIICGARCT